MKKTYEAPQVEVLEIAVEQGFAASGIDDMPYGNPHEW
jgi:hypothetical protein